MADASRFLQSPRRSKPKGELDAKRVELRERLWPNSALLVWDRLQNQGFTTVPRLLPLILRLIGNLSKKENPSRVYLDLWLRAFDQGIVTITDEAACAFSSGYSGTRGQRSWRERVFELSELDFVKIKPNGIREIGHVLILNPLVVCAKWYAAKPSLVTQEWWSAFLHRASEIGAKIPTDEDRVNWCELFGQLPT